MSIDWIDNISPKLSPLLISVSVACPFYGHRQVPNFLILQESIVHFMDTGMGKRSLPAT